MARRVRSPEPPISELDDYRAAKLCRAISMRLAVPATDDPVTVHRYADALERGQHAATAAGDWPGRVAALEAAWLDAHPPGWGEQTLTMLRRGIEDQEPPGDAERRALYVRSIERGFVR